MKLVRIHFFKKKIEESMKPKIAELEEEIGNLKDKMAMQEIAKLGPPPREPLPANPNNNTSPRSNSPGSPTTGTWANRVPSTRGRGSPMQNAKLNGK